MKLLNKTSVEVRKDIVTVKNPEDNFDDYFKFKTSELYRPHMSAGVGMKIAMNENFILSVDWAFPFDKQDGQV